MLFSPQMPLQLEPTREQSFENFVPGPNEPAVASLQAALAEPGSQVYLTGPPGSGKSHLLNALCLAARRQGLTAFYAGLATLPGDAHGLLDGLEELDLLCVDDMQLVAGDPAWETALFHCINRLRERQGRWVVASQVRLRALPVALPDLASRLQWGLRLAMQPLADEDKLRVLEQHAMALGIDLPDEVCRYLIRRSSRHMLELTRLLERLQHAAFVSKRRITVPMAREIIADHEEEGAL